MTARVFFDTNILVYALSVRASSPVDPRTSTAEELLSLGGAVSAQVINEFADVASWKLKMGWDTVAGCLDMIDTLCGPAISLTAETTRAAVRLSKLHGFRMYDSLILASAIAAGCRTLLTEDLQHGQIIEGLRIENPFL
jgi:predicted nucleic acid-binding protein